LVVAKNEKLVAVLGATGFTGRLVAQELYRHDVLTLLAGRNSEKLDDLAAVTGGAETAVVEVRDTQALDALANRVGVVINCVGPFIDFGETVVRAAIAAGTHYIDTTGEQPFVKNMLVHQTWAQSQNVAVVPALGFDVAVADCGAALAAEGLDGVEAVQVTYAVRIHTSQGTKRSALRMLQSDGFAYVDGEWVAEAPARHMVFVDFPKPVGRVAAVSFPSAEVITIPLHVKVREVRAFMAMPRIAARVLSATGVAVGGLVRSPIGSLLSSLIGEGTGGPGDEKRREDSFHVCVDARGMRGGKAEARRIVLSGRDVYGLTAAIVRQGAQLLLAGRHTATGILPPAGAFQPKDFLDGLQAEGLAYDSVTA
jgi:short subunit dehydrogenase-like uncharacterized protein